MESHISVKSSELDLAQTIDDDDEIPPLSKYDEDLLGYDKNINLI